LEQFEVFPINLLGLNDFLLELDLEYFLTLMLTIFSLTSIVIVFDFLRDIKTTLKYSFLIPQEGQFVYEEIYSFLLLMLTQQTQKKGELFFPIVATIFSVICLSNLNGLAPFGFTLTSSLFMPFFLAFSLNISLVFLGFYLHQWRFLKLFVPLGIPNLLKPLIVVIEVVSYLIRSFSLSLRLFANMMAGHCLLNIMSFFVKTLFSLASFLYILAIFPFLLVLFVSFLEIGIAILQAYVFSILFCIYLNEAINLH